jgi:hypothetical protein
VYKEIYEKLWKLKKQNKNLTLYEIGIKMPIEDPMFLALWIEFQLNQNQSPKIEYSILEVSDDLSQALKIMTAFYENKGVLMMMRGRDSKKHYEWWLKKNRQYLMDIDWFTQKVNQDEILCMIKPYPDLEKDLFLLSEGEVAISVLGVDFYQMYLKSIQFKEKDINLSVFGFIELINVLNVNMQTLIVGNILYQIKEKDEKSFQTLLNISNSFFVKSLIFEHPIYKSEAMKSSRLRLRNEIEYIESIIKIAQSVPVDVFRDKSYEFVRTYFL